jgi:2-polyprenyl-3-methyl-5-hydroxy-6-metoxy-1,4-benzoquinol methylase
LKYKKVLNKDTTVSVFPVPTSIELKEFYSNSYYQNPKSSSYQIKYPEIEIRHKKHKAEILLKVIREFSKAKNKSSSFLDIGCGEGFVLSAAQKEGFKVEGFDFSEFGIKKFHPHLLRNFSAGDAAELLHKRAGDKIKYDYISIINVLEHVIDPKKFLKSLLKICKRTTIIALTVPNDFSIIQKRLLQKKLVGKEYWFAPPAHLHYFNTQNIKRFLNNHKLKILDMYSDFPVDFFLFHNGSNYIKNKKNGQAAHMARMEIDLLLAEGGASSYLDLCRAMSKCGVGRDFTVISKVS